MPLVSNHLPFTNYPDQNALGFWMTDAAEARLVKVFATYSMLSALDPSKLADLPAAREILSAHRQHVERIASQKFDAGDVEGEVWLEAGEEFPIVRISSDDL